MPKRNDQYDPKPEEELLTIQEATTLLGVDTRTLRNHIRDSIIKPSNVVRLPERGIYRIQRTTIDTILKRRGESL